MVSISNVWARATRLACRLAPLAMAIYIELASSPLLWAAKKKKEEVAAPIKSYVVPYMIVIAVVGMGIMTVIRPGTRKDGVPENKKDQEE